MYHDKIKGYGNNFSCPKDVNASAGKSERLQGGMVPSEKKPAGYPAGAKVGTNLFSSVKTK